MAKKMRPALTLEQKKHLAYKRKRSVLVLIIVLLVALIGVELVLLITELVKLAA